MHKRAWVPVAAGVCTAAVVLALSGQHGGAPAPAADASVPAELAAYSHLTGSVSDSPPGTAVALYQHGFGVEFVDSPQAVTLGAGGDVYRRVDAAEARAGSETQGDPAPMLLSPDGSTVAVGDHDVDEPDVVLVDLTTGSTTRHSLPAGRSVVPLAWSSDGQRLAHLISAEPTNPHSGEPTLGQIGLLDVRDGSSTLLDEAGRVSAAAFSPDGSELALQQVKGDGEGALSVLDLAGGSLRTVEATGALAGPAAWSPDGLLLATTMLESSGTEGPIRGTPAELVFVDPRKEASGPPPTLPLPLYPQGHVLGWNGSDEVLTLLTSPDEDACCDSDTYELASVPLDGEQPRTLMRLSDLQDFGVDRFQLASSLTDDLRVVDPVEVDRGGWPLWLRGGLATLLGLLAFGATFAVRRRVAA